MALQDHRSIPGQPQPAQVGLNRLHSTSTVAWGIEVVDTQQPHSPLLAGLQPGEQGRLEVAPVQHPRRRRGIPAAVNAFRPQLLAPIELLLKVIGNSHQTGTAIKKAARNGPRLNIAVAGTVSISPEHDP